MSSLANPDLTTLQRKLAERRAATEKSLRENARVQAQEMSTKEQHDADLVPEEPFDVTDADKQMDKVIDNIDILDAYMRWCNKMVPVVKGNQRESIMISCPIPTHADKIPSAWINLDKQTWYCGGCTQGGDTHDIAAFHFGFPVPGYKVGAQFHELRREMAKDFGFTFITLPGGAVQVEAPYTDGDTDEDKTDTTVDAAGNTVTNDTAVSPPKPVGLVASAEPTESAEDEADVIEMFDVEESNILIPVLDWRQIIPTDSFLGIYMRQTCLDDVPEEYHFWNGLLALGFALGREVVLDDLIPVYPNLFLCTLGYSGSGKSKAKYHLSRLLEMALPHDWNDPNSKGVRRVPSPGSAEVLIHNFQKPVADPTNPKVTLYHASVRGLIDFNELSSLIGRTNRTGNVLIPTLMSFYDVEDVIATSSMATGVKEAHQPFASALTTSQPLVLKDLLSKSDSSSGFLNRWVFVSGTDKVRIAIGGAKIDVAPCVLPLQRVLAWSSTFDPDEKVTWSEEAADCFANFFHSRIEIDKKRDKSELLVRTDLLIKKLILLFTANRQLKEVPLQSVEDAIFCYDYIIGSYALVAEQIGNTLSNEISDKVLACARKQYSLNKRGVTLSQVARSLKYHKYPNDILLKVFDSLVKLGFLEIQRPEPGLNRSRGRPTVRYCYVK